VNIFAYPGKKKAARCAAREGQDWYCLLFTSSRAWIAFPLEDIYPRARDAPGVLFSFENIIKDLAAGSVDMRQTVHMTTLAAMPYVAWIYANPSLERHMSFPLAFWPAGSRFRCTKYSTNLYNCQH